MRTVAIRLMNIDGYVEFEYDTINLKPALDLAAMAAAVRATLRPDLNIINEGCKTQVFYSLIPKTSKEIEGRITL